MSLFWFWIEKKNWKEEEEVWQVGCDYWALLGLNFYYPLILFSEVFDFFNVYDFFSGYKAFCWVNIRWMGSDPWDGPLKHWEKVQSKIMANQIQLLT